MNIVPEILAWAGYGFIAFGIVTFAISIIGILRMPDSYTRIHAGTKASTLATLLIVAGVICLRPEWVGKLLILAVFILATSPVSSSILVKGAYVGGSPMETKEGTAEYRDELVNEQEEAQ